MTKTLIVSDANILIDIEVSGLTRIVFELDIELAVPDTLFHEEIAPYYSTFEKTDLKIVTFSEITNVLLVEKTYFYRNTALSRNDISAMVLALTEKCTLLTGESLLRTTAENEGLEVHGMLWLMEELFNNKLINAQGVIDAYEAMRQDGSRLPWDMIEKQIRKFNK